MSSTSSGSRAGLLTTSVFGVGDLVRDDASNNGLADERNDGWYVWEWNPGDLDASLTGTGLSESFRFALRPLSAAVDVGRRICRRLFRSGVARPLLFNGC